MISPNKCFSFPINSHLISAKLIIFEEEYTNCVDLARVVVILFEMFGAACNIMSYLVFWQWVVLFCDCQSNFGCLSSSSHDNDVFSSWPGTDLIDT